MKRGREEEDEEENEDTIDNYHEFYIIHYYASIIY